MKFTGERYHNTPNCAVISYEHWHRYLYATQFVKGKIVLDIASGDGYGTDLMAQTAKTVVGVDISQEAVDFATEHYPKNNLSFRQGSVENIPIDGLKQFDVIVSFETIEHVDAGAQEVFLKEVKRLLKDDGIFIVSSPNKLYYSDIPQYKTDFHIKEFYEEEFASFLKKYFNHVTLLGQKICTGSNMWRLDSADCSGSFAEYQITNDGQRIVATNDKKESLYLIAVCSEAKTEAADHSLLVDISLSLLSERDKQIATLNEALVKHDEALAQRDARIIRLKQTITDRETRFNEITSSYSWKMTRPLREAGRWLMKQINDIKNKQLKHHGKG
jgi:cyclopropane fatty-acyl-phospholipid synthase-like methyltransferase